MQDYSPSRNKQTFVNNLYGKLRDMLEYLCELNGITFVMQEKILHLQKQASGIRMSYQSIRVVIVKNIISVVKEYIVDSTEQLMEKC